MLELEKFIKSHDNWEEILTKAPYCLKIARDDGYIMLKYNQIFSDFTNSLVREARGIIFKDKTFEPVCVPFFKFANAEEEYSDLAVLDWNSASVQEKVDGSLIKVWFDEGSHVSTNGTINAMNAQVGEALNDSTFLDLFNEGLKEVANIFWTKLDHDYTYMFELVSPKSRVVIEYPETKLYFLGARNNKTLEEVNIDTSKLESIKFLRENFDIPKRYRLNSYEAVKEAANALPWNEEGYVVCDKYFHRVKIKSPEYVKAHHGRTNGNVSLLRLINIILTGETSEFLIYAADYIDKVNNIEKAMFEFKEKMAKTVIELNPESFATRKELAEKVKTYPKHYQAFLFKYDNLDSAFARLRPSQWKDIFEIEGVLSNKEE